MPIPEFREDGWLPVGHHVATWEEVFDRFDAENGSRRRRVSDGLRWLRDGLRAYGVRGRLVLDGGYVSSKLEPHDFDVLLVAEPGLDPLKQSNPTLAALLDPQRSEDRGYSILYCQTNSSVLDLLLTVWDRAKNGIEKGVIEVDL
jgi:hypothetical protein